MEKLSFRVADFEGPLDLLLFLISKHKLNIYDIEISLLLEQYMEAIGELRLENMETASEFMEMASRLVYIKTATLLPKYEDEAADLKQELVGQLLEYQLCKEVAAELGRAIPGGIGFCPSARGASRGKAYTRQHRPEEILKAYLLAVGRKRRLLPPAGFRLLGHHCHPVCVGILPDHSDSQTSLPLRPASPCRIF